MLDSCIPMHVSICRHEGMDIEGRYMWVLSWNVWKAFGCGIVALD